MADLSVAMRTLGCKVNRVEAEKIAARLLGTGVAIVDEDEAAVVVVTTCTVTGEADHKARKAVRHALGLPQSPVVVVTGCLASVDPDGLAALGERVIVEPDKDLVPARVAAVLGTRICPAGVVPRIGEA
ncbi:MAG: 2-methylthioadenine synthetase, partial [Coriobacteriia bacterium]|nr:2-methylthioadenine synthetase [Coriobacteriia bacterium]